MDNTLLWAAAVLVWVGACAWSNFKLNRAQKEIVQLKGHMPQPECHDGRKSSNQGR